jgi:hypothetical protein
VVIINVHGDIKYLPVDRDLVLVGDSFKVCVGADAVALTEALMLDRYS